MQHVHYDAGKRSIIFRAFVAFTPAGLIDVGRLSRGRGSAAEAEMSD